MGALSHDQFATKVNEGGASRLLHTQSEVPLERGQYAVSDPNHELVLAHPVVRAEVEAHHQTLMADPTLHGNPRAMQGGWTAGQPPKVYLDSSELVAGRRQAVARGRENGQLAVFSHSRALGEKPDTEVYMKRTGLKSDTEYSVTGNRKVGYTREKRTS